MSKAVEETVSLREFITTLKAVSKAFNDVQWQVYLDQWKISDQGAELKERDECL